ncbi:MAG TPA: colicin immunity domain-containing protein [Pseudonocardiaceae bacterium]|nr:colicin immunity domain-containing protein [Pseudonocardiaceae bacterium]
MTERPMRKFPRGTTKDAAPYIDLIQKFASGKIAAPEFETAYLLLFQSENKVLPDTVEQPLNDLFYAVDDYVEDPQLRADVNGLDDDQVRDRAASALRLLVAAVVETDPPNDN